MFHLTEARPMCGAIFSQSTSRLLRIALLCRPIPPPRGLARAPPPRALTAPLPAARSGAPGGRRSGQDERWERGG